MTSTLKAAVKRTTREIVDEIVDKLAIYSHFENKQELHKTDRLFDELKEAIEEKCKQFDKLMKLANDINDAASRMSYILIVGGGNDINKVRDDWSNAARQLIDMKNDITISNYYSSTKEKK